MKKSLLIKRVTILLVTLVLSASIGLIEPKTAYAGTQIFVVPDETKPMPVNLLNGSFQTPEAGPLGYGTDFPNGGIAGWRGGYYVTVLLVGVNDSLNYGLTADSAADGNQYAELIIYNFPDYSNYIYQTVNTTPNTRLLWSFAHRASRCSLAYPGTATDSSSLYMVPGTVDLPSTHNPPLMAPYLVYTATDNGLAWGYHRGTYTVPAGQTSTHIDFYATARNSAIFAPTYHDFAGNYIDDVKIQTSAKLIAKKSISTSAADDATARMGETVTITVAVTNWGETDASRCVFRDILSDGLDYVAGSATINGVAAGTLATFNNTTDELRINYGLNATAGTTSTNGGIVRGTESMGTSGQGETVTLSFQALVTGNAGYVVQNQASTTYNDSDWESYNAGDFTAYSSVLGRTPTSADQTSYVNQFTVVGTSISGRVWNDDNGDGVIDPSEPAVASKLIGLYAASDTSFSVPFSLVFTDDNGLYSFNDVGVGSYLVATPVMSDKSVTVLANDNDAVVAYDINGARIAIISPINVTSLTPITNMDIGFASALRTLTVEKRVTGAAADPNQMFTFQISFPTMASTTLSYTGASTVAGVPAPANGTINSSWGTVSLRHGQSITIQGIPAGTSYSVAEVPVPSGYSVTISGLLNGSGSSASGTLTDDGSLLFTNTLNTVVPTGVFTDIVPYALMAVLLGGVVALSLTIASKKRRSATRRR